MTEVNLKQYDNTSKIASYLDVHMMNPLLDFIREVIELFISVSLFLYLFSFLFTLTSLLLYIMLPF